MLAERWLASSRSWVSKRAGLGSKAAHRCRLGDSRHRRQRCGASLVEGLLHWRLMRRAAGAAAAASHWGWAG